MFNSALVYELSVLKLYAEPLLFQIEEGEPEYQEAKRLLKFLDYLSGCRLRIFRKTRFCGSLWGEAALMCERLFCMALWDLRFGDGQEREFVVRLLTV